MRAQSSIEFLSTYGFVFIIMSLAIALIIFLTSYSNNVVSSQCTSFSELTCNFVNYYQNATYGYGIITLSLSNSQTAPINITTMNASIDTYTGVGTCTPSFLYPGQETTCIVAISISSSQNNLHNGAYYLGAGFCSAAENNLTQQGCTYTESNYTGTFETYSAANDTMPFSVVVAYPTSSVQLPSRPSSPYIPSNYVIVQNGDFVPSRNLTGFDFAFGTTAFQTDTYFGLTASPYPAVVSVLNSNTVPCTSPYQSEVSIAYSTFYMPGTSTVGFAAYTDNAVEVYYKQPGWFNWVSAFNGGGWNLNYAPGTEHTGSNSLGPGLYDIAVENVNACGDGLDAVSVNGIGQ